MTWAQGPDSARMFYAVPRHGPGLDGNPARPVLVLGLVLGSLLGPTWAGPCDDAEPLRGNADDLAML